MLLAVAMLAAPVYAKAYKSISVDKAYSMIFVEDHPDLVVLDIRPAGAYAGGHIEGAINVQYADLQTWMASAYGESLLNNKILVHCYGGILSPKAAADLSDGGFKKVYSMEGGILAWIDAEYPTVT